MTTPYFAYCHRSRLQHAAYSPLAARFAFSAKERDVETGLSYFGARYYSSDLSIWLSVDPMSDKYPSLSPYVYCANNPVKLVDPNGEKVHPMGEEEYEMILNTLPQEDRDYVQLDKKGNIDKKIMDSHQSESNNYNSLLTLVKDKITFDIELRGDDFPYVDKNGNMSFQTAIYQEVWEYSRYDVEGVTANELSTGEGGNLGLTLFPGTSEPTNSPDKNVKIFINKNLSEKGRAESFSHEAYGHGYLYSINGHNAYNASHWRIPLSEGGDANAQLHKLCVRAKRETIQNMKQ